MSTTHKNIPPSQYGEAVDLSHHLSILARQRMASPLKDLFKYLDQPGMISLAGGLPHPECFPFENIGGSALKPNNFPKHSSSQEALVNPLSWIFNLFSNSTTTIPVEIPKYSEIADNVNLSTSLQYSMATGIPQLEKIIHEFTAKVYKPAYSNFGTTVHTGNTDGWTKIMTTLCNPGEGILASEWTYPSALATMRPYNIEAIPVPMDEQGMMSDGLRDVLASWDEAARGRPRPHVLYVVPIGQNPTGVTMHANRKREIYEICVEYDIIIVEDDPYYFLQEGEYVPPNQRPEDTIEEDDEKFLTGLAPSFLSFDYQGRVVRLDTFSKTIAPGCRLGWFTCHPVFIERLQRQTETTTQAPCGFSQALVTSLLLEWQYTGFLRWLKGLGKVYTNRRNFFIDSLMKKFDFNVEKKREGTVFYAYEKLGGMREKTLVHPLFSFVPPSSGMFVWFRFHFGNHKQFKQMGQKTLESKLWTAIADAGLLLGPGQLFAADSTVFNEGEGHYRVSFSNATFEELTKAVEILASTLHKFYHDEN